jgi:integrase
MVCALGTPKRHPESGIYWFRKRVPDRLRESVGKTEIKFSLQTRDPLIARLRNLEAILKIERERAGYDIAVVGQGRTVAHLECKSSLSRGSGEAPLEMPLPAFTPSGEKEPASKPIALDAVFKSYAAEAELAASTVKRWKGVIDRFVDYLGHDNAGDILRSDVVAWKDSLLAGGISNVTTRDVYLAAVKATLQYGMDQGTLIENPAAGVKVRVKSALKEREKGFEMAEAVTILAATLRPPSDKISIEMAAVRRWVPWICAYSGARVNEITPLSGRDFTARDGIPMMRIRAETNKTRKSRMVPLHGHLIEQGLLAYAKSRGARPLFYDRGGISVFSPGGDLVEFHEAPEVYCTNICFGGDEMRTAFITLSGTGRLIAVDWPRAGLPLHDPLTARTVRTLSA